jgi:glycosyltransferase involved in cell wall biosynthesis
MGTSDPARPTVSVIVPARNEEACLHACLDSLSAQQGIAFEIIVVNDGSTDRTREIAASYTQVRVIDAPALPPGWTGKNNAVTAGARIAAGEWLLFTDADTVHLPGSLRRSVAEAQKNRAALLSYSPEQIVSGLAQRAVMPLIFAELATTYRPADVSNPSSAVAAANGQYLLISREAYDSVGGHAAVAGDLLEDVALARQVKKSGRRIFFRYGSDAVRTRMYRSFGEMREGWTKNLAVLFAAPQRLALLRFTEFALLAAGIAVTVLLFGLHAPFRAVVVGLSTATGFDIFFSRVRKAHFSWLSNTLAFLGLPIFAYLLLRSTLSYKNGNVAWKGRRYEVPELQPSSGRQADMPMLSHNNSDV